MTAGTGLDGASGKSHTAVNQKSPPDPPSVFINISDRGNKQIAFAEGNASICKEANNNAKVLGIFQFEIN